MDNFRYFFVNKQTNTTLPFARWANGKRNNKNRLGFHFPFYFFVKFWNSLIFSFHFSMFMCTSVHVSMSRSPYLYVSMSLSPCLNVSISLCFMSQCLCLRYSMSPRLHIHVSMSLHTYVSMSPCLKIVVVLIFLSEFCACNFPPEFFRWIPEIYFRGHPNANGKWTNGKRQLRLFAANKKRKPQIPFVCCKR